MRTWLSVALTLCISGAGCTVKFEWPATESPAVIVTVDGMSFPRTLLDIYVPDPENYLEAAIEAMDLDVPANHVIPFVWSSNSNETAQAVTELRQFLREQYTAAQDDDKAFVIVTHSWGGLLACAALELESQGDDPIVCDLLLISACPLATGHAHDPPLYELEETVIDYVQRTMAPLEIDADTHFTFQTGRCVNYWAWSDLLSGPMVGWVDGVEDVKLDPFTVEDGPIRRSILTTPSWHKYSSLQNGGLLDNQPFKDRVAQTIRQALAAVEEP